MNETVEFLDQVYWHTDPTGTILWNAKLRKGWTASVSWSSQFPSFEDATTPYAALHRHQEKEALWEEVRQREFPNKPTRLRALFLFVSREDAEHGMKTWFSGQNRDLFPLLVPKTSTIHIADTNLLNAMEADWETNARRYWAGEMSSDPFREGVLYGPAFIPNIDKYQITLGPRG